MALKKQPIRDAIRRKLVESAVEQGADRAHAEATLKKMEGERPILDWLINGGFEQLLKLFLQLIALFAAENPAGAGPVGEATA